MLLLSLCNAPLISFVSTDAIKTIATSATSRAREEASEVRSGFFLELG